ncbi:MAG TPA: alpha/beta fold hydrolase [Thermoleophilia bacterium]|nr:alpha/beta fold hydrolase [Thermoleophilia bacterium]
MDASPSPGPPPPKALRIESDGLSLAGRLFLPAGPPVGALLVCHGAGSRKENHRLMGEQAAAAGLATLTFDFRGHGGSEGVMGPDGWRDTVAAGRRLLSASGAPWLAARGASMGGCFLLLAAHAHPGLFRSLVLLCPADGASLLAGLDRYERAPDASPPDPGGRAYGGRFDSAALRPFLERLDLVAAARGLPRVLLAHARDDEDVPIAHSERLAAVLAPPTEFIRLDAGGHHGPGRSPLVARATVDWVLRHGG